ncbi:alpha/beta hydrolase [Kitasatospora sp. GP82]|uniref:alpha/beta fold hydrolase n=1 Tax=Kitasatospora sp. GP82 TaxID=3035089 RepID=UPI002476C248|nr:alpha/beta hydrolase [Kitasatospora sp. GP82]MDH6130547.1 pimeloyl-ACP methyl ester carboxylesterase [Kitasatospora sp. GP82]
MTVRGLPVVSAVFTPKTAPATGNALVLAPVIPEWDGGTFFAPVIRTLLRTGLRVTVLDTLSVWDETVADLPAFVDRWAELLTRFAKPDLLCGNALGGAVAQALLPALDPGTAALLVSAPAVADPVLDARLTEIGDLAAAGRTADSLALLHRYVLPEGVEPFDSCAATSRGAAGDDPQAGRRMATGMRLLPGVDVSKQVTGHPGPLLGIVGGLSRLVGLRHTAAAAHHRVHEIPGCGMRPHSERPDLVDGLVESFLHENGLS